MPRFYVSAYSFIMIVTLLVAARNCNTCNQIEAPQRRCNPVNSENQPLGNRKPQNGLVNSDAIPQDIKPPPQRPRNRCCPYDFDSNLCRIVDDRLLCGYNKNQGFPKSKGSVVNLHGGCRLRGGRLECGYEQAPFTNPRRPPVWDKVPPGLSDDDDNQEVDKISSENEVEKENKEERVQQKLTDVTLKVTRPIRAVTRCVEIGERIVCRHL